MSDRGEHRAVPATPGDDARSIIDISPVLSPRISVFPGDTPLTREVLLDAARGDVLTLSTLRSTVHVGAHADAPSHYAMGRDAHDPSIARTIEGMGLEHYLGPCVVMRARVERGEVVTVDRLDLGSGSAPTGGIEARVLIRTDTQPDKRVFNADFAPLSVDLIERLRDMGVITVGVDTPSVDAGDSKDLPVHQAFLRARIAIIEGLELAHVEPGRYELIALPLRLEGFDASPVRAVLRRT